MDATYQDQVFTPRWGLAVEFQALWIRACEVLAREAEGRGQTALSEEARERALSARRSFVDTFWCYETQHPFDCLSEHRDSASAWADPSIRPNALIALSLCPDLFEPWQVGEILARVEERLLTDRGIRTLEPGSPQYVGHGGGTVPERSSANHQGTIWPHLLLFYVRSKLKHDPSAGPQLRDLVHSALSRGRALGHIAQCADADPPHRPWGIPAYAAATGMLLEALAWDLAGV
jgi:predicted glycogen debranching enzyme